MKPHILFLACWLAIGLAQGQDTRGVKQSHEETEMAMGKAKYYALIMAVNDYQFDGHGLSDLNKPIADAKKLKKCYKIRACLVIPSIKICQNDRDVGQLDESG